MSDDQPVKPANILNIVAINQGKRRQTLETPKVKPLAARDVEELMAAGCALVDARSSAAFGAGHVPGSFNVQKSSSEFEQRLGWVVPDDSQILLLAESATEAQQCIYEMAFIGLDQFVVGYLEGGIVSWMDAGMPLEITPQIDVHTVSQRLSANELHVIDVRAEDEWDEGHIEGAHFMPFTSMAPQLDVPARIDELPMGHDEPIAVTCATGKRSSTAASLLLRHGYTRLFNVTGGMVAWQHAGLPMVDATGQACSV